MFRSVAFRLRFFDIHGQPWVGIQENETSPDAWTAREKAYSVDLPQGQAALREGRKSY